MLRVIAASVIFCAVAFINGERITGGKYDQDPSRPMYMEIAWRAAKALNEDSALNSGSYAMMPIQVLKAQSQVVAGTNFYLEVLYGESGCKKNEVDLAKLKIADCKVMNEGKRAVYNISYYVKPWQNYEKFNISKVKDIAAMTGGKQIQDPSKPVYMDIAWKAAKTLNEDSALNSGSYAMMPIKVLKAQSQVVAGVNFYLQVLYGESGCKKNGVDLAKLQIANCKVMNGGKRAVIYNISYYAKPWQNYEKTSISKVKDIAATTERERAQDPRKVDYWDLAWKFAISLNKESPATGENVLIPIEILSTGAHLASGGRLIYDMDVVLGETDCKKKEVDLDNLKTANCKLVKYGYRGTFAAHRVAEPRQNHVSTTVSSEPQPPEPKSKAKKDRILLMEGKRVQDPSKPEFMDIAWEAAKTLNKNSTANSCPSVMIPIRIVTAETQVVSGITYLRVLYGETNCKKDKADFAKLQAANCKVTKKGKRALYGIRCDARSWHNQQIKVSEVKTDFPSGAVKFVDTLYLLPFF